jgi:hypothetical protein
MTDVNVQAFTRFDPGNFLEPDPLHAPLFNTLFDGNFGVSALFKLRGDAMPVGNTPMMLFGQDNDLTGWALKLGQLASGEWGVIASNNASPGDEAEYPLTRSVGADPLPLPGLTERLILATMVYGGEVPGPGNKALQLYINGDLVSSRIQNVSYVPSPNPPRVGALTSAPVTATGLEIVGVAFIRTVSANLLATTSGMAMHYKNCRAAGNMMLISDGLSAGTFDFTHRWNAREAITQPAGVTARAPNTANKVFGFIPPGAVVANGSSVLDTGNRGFTSNSAIAFGPEPEIPLIATSNADLVRRNTVNPDWHQGSAFSVAPPT